MPLYDVLSKGFINGRIHQIGEVARTDEPLKPTPKWLKLQETKTERTSKKPVKAAAPKIKEPDFKEVDESLIKKL